MGTFQHSGAVVARERIWRLSGYAPARLHAMTALDERCFDRRFRFDSTTMRHYAEQRGSLVCLAVPSDPLDVDPDLAGFAIVHMLGRVARRRSAYLVTLDVDPEHRRSGLARLLMASLEADAIRLGAARMMLHVFVDNAPALALYRRLGYRELTREPAFYGPGLDALVFARDLTLF